MVALDKRFRLVSSVVKYLTAMLVECGSIAYLNVRVSERVIFCYVVHLSFLD